MPTYGYQCDKCGWGGDLVARIAARDEQYCPAIACGHKLRRELSAPRGRVMGEEYNKKNDTINRATAALTGIPYKDLPSGLKV